MNKDSQRDPNNFKNSDRNLSRNDLPPYYPENGTPSNNKNGSGPGPRPIGPGGPMTAPVTGSGSVNYPDDRYSNGNVNHPNNPNNLNTSGNELPDRGSPNFYGNNNNRNGGDINNNNNNNNNGNNGRYYHSFK